MKEGGWQKVKERDYDRCAGRVDKAAWPGQNDLASSDRNTLPKWRNWQTR